MSSPSPDSTANPTSAAATDRCTLCDLPTPDPAIPGEEEGTFCCTGCREVYRTLDDLDADEAAAVRERIDGTDAAGQPVPEEADLADLLTRGGYTASLDRSDADATADTVARLLFGGFFTMMVMVWYIVFLYPVYAGGTGLVPLEGEFAHYALGNVWVATSVAFVITGWPLIRSAGGSLRVLQPNMDLLVVLAAGSAYLYSTGALLLGQTEVYFDVTVVIIFVVSLGRWFEARVKRRATGLLADLTREQANTARRVGPNGATESVDVDDLAAGDTVRVRQGERIPVDGTVAEGRATVDESLLTGEAKPVGKTQGDAVIGGSVVQTNALTVTVGTDAPSTLDQLVQLMWEIQASTPGVQQVADRLASLFVPLVLLLGAGAVGLQLCAGTTLPHALLTGLTVLIVSCPCTLELTTPLAVAAGTRAGLKNRIVVKHAGVFEQAADLDMVAFDKTGTLTTGQVTVVDTVGDQDVLRRARAIEQWSSHPVAEAIVDSGPAASANVTDVETHPRGIAATMAEERVFVGHPEAYRKRGGRIPEALADRTETAVDNAKVPVVVGQNGQARGLFVVGDAVRDEADAVLDRLADNARLAVCTGDHDAAAAPLHADDRIEDVFAGVRPAAKRALLRQWRAKHGAVAMVGDGGNDAPALADADLGVAFGPTALAAGSADVVILDDDLSRVPDVLSLAKATRRRIRQNLG